MSTPSQESALTLRAAFARPPATARAPRPEEPASLFSGLLAVSLAQAPLPGLLGQGGGADPAAAPAPTAGWPLATAAMAAATPPPGQVRTTPAAPEAAKSALPATAPIVEPASATAGAPAPASTVLTSPADPQAAPAPTGPLPMPPESGPPPAIPVTAAPADDPGAVLADAAPPQNGQAPAVPVATPTAPAVTPPGGGSAFATIARADAATYAAAAAAAPTPPSATPRQSLADAWLAANLALATAAAPAGEAAGTPFAADGSAVPDADATGARTGAAGPADAPAAAASRQVAIQLLKQAGDATAPGGRLTIRLDPPQLGRVEVSFEQRGDRLLVTLTAQTPEAERALRNGAGELQQALAGSGGRWQDAQVKIETASGRDGERPDGDETGDRDEQPSRRRREREEG